jgi:hypothetical protein
MFPMSPIRRVTALHASSTVLVWNVQHSGLNDCARNGRWTNAVSFEREQIVDE